MSSLEGFGRIVSPDYFHGRVVTDVRRGDGDEGSPAWVIVLEGDAEIRNYDPSIPMPKAIVGAALTRTLLSVGQTRFQFGLEQVTMNPLEYSIQDERYTDGKEVFAQRSEANMPPEVPAEPEGRTAEGPEQPYAGEDGA